MQELCNEYSSEFLIEYLAIILDYQVMQECFF